MAAVIDVKSTPIASKQIGPASRLAAVKAGVIRTPKRYVIYGAEGTGKTTLAADAPSPIFLDIEGGSDAVNVARYPFRDEVGGHVPATYQDVIGALNDLMLSQHSYRTVVIDTIDRLESLIWNYIIDKAKEPQAGNKKDGEITSIESFGYGKGYVLAVDEWRALAVKLDRLRNEKKMEIVLLAHSQVKNFKNPEGPDYDRWIPGLNVLAAGFLKGWSDITARICHEETTKKEGKYAKAKGIATGVRVLKLAHSAAFDAKGRGNLPEEIEVPAESPWAPLAAAIEAGYEDDAKKLVGQISEETTRIGDEELTAKVDDAVKAALAKNDVAAMKTYLNSLKTRPAKSAEAQQ